VTPFRYLRPTTIAETVQALADHGPDARLLAGGTDLLVRLRLGHIRPAVVVDVKRVAELGTGIHAANGLIRIGARTVMTDIIADAGIRRHFPALAESARVVGSVQIRNRATLAGNVCNASPAADTAPALLAYGAVVQTLGPGGPRRVPLAEFFTGPGRTVLFGGELVQHIDLPMPAAPAGAAFGRVTRRWGVDLATINMCCVVTAAGETRFAFGAVGPTPFLVVDTSGMLARPAAGPAERHRALEALIAGASPISDVRGSQEYRRAMLEVVGRRSLDTALERLARAVTGGETP
jgi:carbon-monoxide dehydrogenase medium subunit